MNDPAEPSASPTALIDIIRRRRMIRSFAPAPLPDGELQHLLDVARRAPSAGNTQAVEFLVLDTPAMVAAYWDATLPPERRSRFRWQALLDAPAIVVVITRPDAYVERYAEADKAKPGLGERTDDWTVPFWWVDAGTVIQNLLLLVTDAGLGACLFGLFDHEAAVFDTFGVPEHYRGVATIAIGRPTAQALEADQDGRSAHRRRPPIDDIIHRGRW